ncbi:DNA polymerase I [Candidatus Paracaedibacter symbiosus]|uniref:DNA polymerase I n=1 Tax=Candidatus Paracaedibacter symbiosus TaxID=244582 RepID=UPI000509A8A4|nr:DNA polymerase I [Candidatus Paracaedibacter symbiosus]
MTKKLYLIDGSGFIFRAFHALPPLRRADGTPVGAVYGFCNILMRFLEQAQANHGEDYLAVIFDAARKTFRQDIYPEYKAHRPDIPEDLIPQFSIIRQACEAFQIPSIELEGYEADDLIASYADEAVKQGIEVIVVSSDKDLMQLVRPGITMLDPIKNKPIADAEVLEKFGVLPEKVIDVQALAGDSVDNVPGIPGIGVKTAAELINMFGDLETLLQQAETIKQPKRRQLLMDYAENARISKQLVTLCPTAPLPMAIEALAVRSPDSIVLKDFVRLQGFTSLVSRLDKQFGVPAHSNEGEKNYHCITDLAELQAFVKEALCQPVVAFDSETTSLNIMEAEVVGFSLSFESGTGVYIPIGHKRRQDQLMLAKEEPLDKQLSLTEVAACLKPLLTDVAVLKVGHNLKYDLGVLAKYDIAITPITDTMLMSYVLDGSKHGHGMDELAERHLMHATIKYTDVVGTGKNQKRFDEVDLERATAYAAEDADVTFKLYQHLAPRLALEKVTTVYERIERPLVPIIVAMEVAGIKVDDALLRQLGNQYAMEMVVLETLIHKLVGRPFNIGSPKQLGEVLFIEMGLPAPKKSKTGAYITDVDVLEKLVEQGHELPAKVLEWRGLSKLKSTYVDGLLAAINHKTGRVHTSYSMAGTSTGRLASSDPNLQNIPIRTEKGRQIRRAFIAEKGHKLLSLDYSQIELRLLAEMADVPQLSKAFRDGHDIHAATASEMFGVPLDQITGDLRRRAKAINFGIIYGISAFGLAQQLSISTGEAGGYIKAYFEKYPGINDYMEKTKDYAREHGYVKTLFGRKCFTPGILDKSPGMRGFAERQAINAPLQGTNADIIKKAMHRIPQTLEQHQLHAKMLLQVHDELIFEVPEAEVEKTTEVLRKLMEGIVHLKVPLVVGVGVGNNWDEAH